MMINELDVLFRISIAIVCGLIIGLERQMTGHAGGIKTNILISFGSCVFVLFSFLTNDTDYTRIAAQVVSGVGFLCSSVIIKNGVTVNGINTSATIWCAAGIGVISSLGKWEISLIVTATLVVANILFYPLAEKIPVLRKFNEQEENVYVLKIFCSPDTAMDVRKHIVSIIDEAKFVLTGVETKNTEEHTTVIKISISYLGKLSNISLENMISSIYENKDVLEVNWKLT